MSKEEYIDAVNESDGSLTGESFPRSIIHSKGIWHRVVHVWILNKSWDALLQRRSKLKVNFPSLWDASSTGHISSGDNSIDSACREVEEELGIHIEPSQLKFICSVKNDLVLNNGTYIDREIADIYVVEMDIDDNEFKLQEGEVDEVKWFPWKDLVSKINSKWEELVPILYDNSYKPFIECMNEQYERKMSKCC